MTSSQWGVYNTDTKRIRYSCVPTSDITAEAVVVDGFTLSQKDFSGIVTTATRQFTANGILYTHTDGPEVWRDQINPNGEGDDTRDYKAWLDTRPPKTVDKAIDAIKKSIENRVQKHCCTKDTTISKEELTKIKYGINNSVIKKAGDEEYSLFEEYLQIGRFSFYVKDVKIKWDKGTYSWSAIAYAEEQTGTTPPDDRGANKLDYVLSKIPFIGKSRKLIIAEYKIGDTGYCNKK